MAKHAAIWKHGYGKRMPGFRPPPALLARPHALESLYLLTVEPGGPLRFGELRALLRAAPNTLAASLRELVAAGLLEREAHATIPPTVTYHPLAPALDLAPILARVRPPRGTHAPREASLRPASA